jgi:hypothetical protein
MNAQNAVIETDVDSKKNDVRNMFVIKDSDEDGLIATALFQHLAKVERLEHDLKIGKLFPN